MGIFNKNGLILNKAFSEAMQTSDGAIWHPIVVHNLQNGANLFSSSDNFNNYVFHNDQCWADFPMIDKVSRPNSNYEILVLQQYDTTDRFNTYRWTQTVSPLTATWEQVNPSSGNITHSGDSASYGGMYILNSSVFMCFANGSKGNWFGCAQKQLWKGTAGVDGSIPGYNGISVSGWQVVYIRVSKNDANVHSNLNEGTNFYEI